MGALSNPLGYAQSVHGLPRQRAKNQYVQCALKNVERFRWHRCPPHTKYGERLAQVSASHRIDGGGGTTRCFRCMLPHANRSRSTDTEPGITGVRTIHWNLDNRGTPPNGSRSHL